MISNPSKYYDQVLELDLSTLEPYVNGPFTPDLATPISKNEGSGRKNGWPAKLEVALIGSCTNSSYEDISRSASIVRDAVKGHQNPVRDLPLPRAVSRSVYHRTRWLLDEFENAGGVVLANACGPCIGQWARHIDDPNRKNTIITSFNETLPNATMVWLPPMPL